MVIADEAHGASSDLTCAPHSANVVSHSGTVLGPGRTNRRWDPQEKAKITAESFAPGANVSGVARRYGVSLGLLHYWRRRVRDCGGLEPISFVPLQLADSAAALARSELEIELGGARVHVRGVVDVGVLRTVFDALRAR
ncbi:MAG: IS66-like element accessory protein TnpA [Terriglobia bacterium]